MQWTTKQLLADALGMGRHKGRRQGRYDDKGFHFAQLVGVEQNMGVGETKSVSVSEAKRDYFAFCLTRKS